MNRRHIVAAASVATALLVAAGPAAGQTAPDQLSFSFTTAKAKAPAGWAVEAEFPRQRIIDQIAITFPAGTKFDRRATAQCTTSSADASAAPGGVAASCPAASKIGSGKGTAYLGDGPDPVTFDLGFYNHRDGALLDIMLGGKTAFSAPVTFRGAKMTIPLRLTPGLNARITAFELAIRRSGTARKPYLRTPGACPSNKKLNASVTARENGAGSETTRDTTTCRR